MRKVTLILVAALLATALSGCAKEATDGNSDTATITTEDGDFEHLDGTGVVRGTVVDDRGFALPGVYVTIIDTTQITQTNQTGGYVLLDLSPGPANVAFVMDDYKEQTVPVKVEANKVVRVDVTMLPTAAVGPGYRTHIHDFWGDVTELTVMDRTWDWNEPHDKDGPYAESAAQKPYNIATQASVHACAYGDPPDMYPYFNNRIIWFDEISDLVYQGTARIDVTISWTEQDYAGPTMKLAYQSTGSETMLEGPEVSSGETFEIELEPNDWDSSHQSFTLWDMAVCRGENAVAVGAGDPPVMGNVHVEMVLHKMVGPIPIEPAHPKFWENGTTIQVVDARETSLPSGASTSRSQYRGNFVVHADEGQLVPPGTEKLLIRLDWVYSGNTAGLDETPLSLTYRAADVWPYTPRSEQPWPIPELVDSGADWKEYQISLDKSQTDAYYQSRSNWAFMLNYEGEETEESFVNSCQCSLQTTLDVLAVMRQDFQEV